MTLFARELPALAPDSELGSAWERLSQASPACGFMQGLAWAAFKREQGLKVIHLGLFEVAAAGSETLVGGAIAYLPARATGTGLMVSPHGPLLDWERPAHAQAGMLALFEAFEAIARREGALGWRIEPQLAPPSPRPLRNFGRAPMDLLPNETLVLDLDRAPGELLAAMRPKGRYNIGLATRRGVTVANVAPEQGVATLYEVLLQAAERNEFLLESVEFFAQLLRTLGPTGQAHLLVAEQGNGPCLGALLLLTHGPRATYLYGGIANHGRQHMAGYALQWAAIQHAQLLGCKTYDFYGYDPFGRPDHLYAKFSRFKRQFGGRVVRTIGAVEHLFVERVADAVVRAVQEIGWSE